MSTVTVALGLARFHILYERGRVCCGVSAGSLSGNGGDGSNVKPGCFVGQERMLDAHHSTGEPEASQTVSGGHMHWQLFHGASVPSEGGEGTHLLSIHRSIHKRLHQRRPEPCCRNLLGLRALGWLLLSFERRCQAWLLRAGSEVAECNCPSITHGLHAHNT